jgi:transcription elongation factor SPT6
LRTTYYERAYVSTIPTAKGQKEINSEHIYASIKRLSKKPVSKFTDTQFLTILKAEKEGYIKVLIEIPQGIGLSNGQ